jgi:hypothetical protein
MILPHFSWRRPAELAIAAADISVWKSVGPRGHLIYAQFEVCT